MLDKPSLAELQEWLPKSNYGALYGIDLETRETDPTLPHSAIVGIGFANAENCFYVNLQGLSDECRNYLREFLRNVRLVAYNVYFDAGFLYKFMGNEWLQWEGCSYGLFKALTTEGYPGQKWDLDTAQRDFLGWQVSQKVDIDIELKQRGLHKRALWQLPASILGPYCATDADAALQIWEHLNEQCQETPKDAWLDYHHRIWMSRTKLLVELLHRGLVADQERLNACHSDLVRDIDSSLDSFLNHHEVAPHLTRRREEAIAAWKRAEPPQHTKQGKLSKRHEQWRARGQQVIDRSFNPNSKQQLEELFYEDLGYKPLKHTETGRRAVDKNVLPALGEPGQLLNKYNLRVKRRGYVEATIEKSRRDGLIHPQFNTFGTLSTRLGGSGGWNFQQMPKTSPFMYSLRARPGMKLIEADAEALEPTILAEFSECPTLWQLYGPDAPVNDVYLFVGAQMPVIGDEIRKYYDPDNPTIEGIKAAKKNCKKLRSIVKLVHLAKTYLAGPGKIYESMKLNGIDISFKEVKEICKGWDRLFSKALRFGDWLQEVWAANGGWIPTALGTPLAIGNNRIKDASNSFCQTSGAQILQLWVSNIERLRHERRVEMYPWLPDQHDETIWESPEEQAEAAAQIMRDALAMTNDELQMKIPIKTSVEIVENLAAVKCEDYEDFLKEKGLAA